MRKRDCFRMTMTFSFFLIQFLFLLRCTELIISPAKVKSFLTATDMLNYGGKFSPLTFAAGAHDPNYRVGYWAERFKQQTVLLLQNELDREGFGNSLQNPAYWRVLNNTAKNFFAEDATDLMVDELLTGATICQTTVYSSEKFMTVRDDLSWLYAMQKNGSLHCHSATKLYGLGLHSYQVNGLNRKEISRILHLISLETRIQTRWSELSIFRTRREAPKWFSLTVREIEIIDTRTLAIFAILGLGLIVSLICFIIESYSFMKQCFLKLVSNCYACLHAWLIQLFLNHQTDVVETVK